MIKPLLFVGLFGALIPQSCSSHKEEKETSFKVTGPMRDNADIIKDYVCQIHSIQHIEIRALEKGYLQNIYVDEGQKVKKGQLMFKIMPALYQAEYEKAEAEAEFAKIEFLNTKALADSSVVAPNELAMAKAKYAKAKAELKLAETHLGFTTIKAPFDGIMDRFHVRLGSLVDEGEMLTTLSDNSKMWVYFNVPEAEYLDYMTPIKTDSLLHVDLIMANGKKFEQVGVVETIEADFNNETGNISFRATFNNPNGLLRHGETGTIEITTPIKDALLIPQKTTFEVLDKRFVFVITEENKVKAREIKIGAEVPHLYVIESGLEESDKILLEGLRRVKKGEEIHYEFIEPNIAMSDLELYAE